MKAHQSDIFLAEAKVIWAYSASIAEFSNHPEGDYKKSREDGVREVAQLAGIVTGWESKPDE